MLQISDIFKLDLQLPADRRGLIWKDTPEGTFAVQIDPGTGLCQTLCATCTSDIREVYQLISLAASLHAFSI